MVDPRIAQEAGDERDIETIEAEMRRWQADYEADERADRQQMERLEDSYDDWRGGYDDWKEY